MLVMAPIEREQAARRMVELLQGYADEAGRLGHAFAAEHGLHRTDASALLAVLRAERDGEPLTPGRLGAELGLSSGATTAAVDRLERLGHLHRRRDDVDRRRVTLHHDAAAEALGRAWFGPLARRITAELDDYDADELALLTGFLERMTAAVIAHRAGADPTPAGVTTEPEPVAGPGSPPSGSA